MRCGGNGFFLRGRVDPHTLATIAGARVRGGGAATLLPPSITLNAHPACDPHTAECYVQHPCPESADVPLSDQACISLLVPTSGADLELHTIR